jgi:hypothetical protein
VLENGAKRSDGMVAIDLQTQRKRLNFAATRL